MSVFSEIDPAHWVASNALAFAVRDRYPVSPGHTLVITKREIATWFDATADEKLAVMALVDELRLALDREYSPAGYNVGFNAGAAAGQTVPHLHLHVIPRYLGDMDDPRGGVRHAIPGKGNYLAQAAPLTTGGADPFIRQISPRFADASRIDIVAAFVQESGVQRLLPSLRLALSRGARIRVLTGDYLDITQAEGLASLMDLAQCGTDLAEDEIAPPAVAEVLQAPALAREGMAVYETAAAVGVRGTLALRVVEVDALQLKSFHPKSWRFEAAHYGVVWVGSSNLSATALGEGIEWNLRVDRDRDPLAYQRAGAAFDALWYQARQPDSRWLAAYEARANRERRWLPQGEVDAPAGQLREPHPIQRDALHALAAARDAGRDRALVVLATGLGKTLLAAFDFERLTRASARPLRLLFVAHRRELLRQAAGAFRAVLAQAGRFPSLGFFVEDAAELDADLVFASVAKLARPSGLARLAAQRFDYVVFDEVHHATAPSWQRVLSALAPQFLLGLTATPERADHADVLGLFDDFIAYEAGISRGIGAGLLAPFHYHGVRDTIDFANLPWRSRRWAPEALTREAATEARMQSLWRAWCRYPGERTLVFCCSVMHAEYVRHWLQAQGVKAAAVHTGAHTSDREAALSDLASGELQAICAVDLFNEGVDLPALDRVVMLRPTESNVLFLQQLGRGLRRHAAKWCLTVIDFVGNHRVFQRRLEALLRTGGGDPPRRLVEVLDADTPVELASGCLVELELEAKDVLRALTNRRAAVEEVYRELRDERGQRPTAGELQRMGLRPGALRKRHNSWFEFVAREGDLSPAEAAALPALQALLGKAETTAMTKSFKMVTLAVLAETGDPLAGLPIGELALRARAWLRRRPELWRDVAAGEGHAGDDTGWVAYWRRNPIEALTTGPDPLCKVVDDLLLPRCAATRADTAASMLWEIVDFRLAQYLDRAAPAPGTDAFRCKLISNNSGNPIAKLPDRKRHELPRGEVSARLPNGSVWVFRFAKEFINVAYPAGESRNRLPTLLRDWFGPRAGQRGTGFHIEFSAQPDGWGVAPASAAIAGAPAIGATFHADELPAAFGEAALRAETGVHGSRQFIFLADRNTLIEPDRIRLYPVEANAPARCEVLAPKDGRFEYLGSGVWLEDEACWAIPATSFPVWRQWGRGREASRRLPPDVLLRAETLVDGVLEEPPASRMFARTGGQQARVLGGAAGGGLRIAALAGAARHRTVSLTDLAWVIHAADETRATGGLLDEARVNRLRYLTGTPKGSTRFIDTGWAIGIWKRWGDEATRAAASSASQAPTPQTAQTARSPRR